ncbi:MAG: HAD family hydrolase [Actinomyces sp.]|uniref:HAD family hydrolase n=1 Tax=Actinomyces sp. TaxID=29317 RepID=UPI0026DBA220|nr:HAD family hydrolase [Actinomyces sp.]MDO4242844.1 HAD family hydrolase [Actinomyces sp.]
MDDDRPLDTREPRSEPNPQAGGAHVIAPGTPSVLGASAAQAPAAPGPSGSAPVPTAVPGAMPSSGPPDPALGLSSELSLDMPGPLGHDDYHALVRRRMADLDALDPLGGGARLVPGPGLLVALDVDGTILDLGGRVSERVMAAIARLRTYGVQVVIATGRGVEAALPVARHVGLTAGWMVCANGAVTLRMDPERPGGYEIVETVTFDPAQAIDALHEAVPDGILAVETPGLPFRVSRPFPDGELIEHSVVRPLDDLRAAPVSRVILRAPGMDVDRFAEIVGRSGLHSVEYAIGWTAWLDVAPPGVTKASALEVLAGRLGTDAGHALAVGDGANDVEMLQWAGAGVVMGSAPQWVQDRGDIVTEPVWHDGCAAVLDALVERTRRI